MKEMQQDGATYSDKWGDVLWQRKERSPAKMEADLEHETGWCRGGRGLFASCIVAAFYEGWRQVFDSCRGDQQRHGSRRKVQVRVTITAVGIFRRLWKIK